MKLTRNIHLFLFVFALACYSCDIGNSTKENLPEPDPNNAGLKLQQNFGAIVSADNLGKGRHMAVSTNGDLYVKLRNIKEGESGIIALRDNDGNGIMDEQKGFMPYGGTGIAINDNYLLRQ
jgi:hypothetical protein